MEDIEYLDEYKDLVLPDIKPEGRTSGAQPSQHNRRISSDSSGSSSIDADIFKKLFDGKLSDDELQIDGGSRTTHRHMSSSSSDESNDALDALFNRNGGTSSSRHDRLDSLDSLDDLGATLLGTTSKITPLKRSNKNASRKTDYTLNRGSDILGNKNGTASYGNSLKTFVGANNTKGSGNSMSNNKSAKKNSSNMKQRPVTLVQPQKNDSKLNKSGTKNDPLNLLEFLGDSDTDSSYEYESDIYNDKETDEEEPVIDISTDTSTTHSAADDVTPVISEDEVLQPTTDNERLQLYLNNLLIAEPIALTPISSTYSPRKQRSNKKYSTTPDQKTASAEKQVNENNDHMAATSTVDEPLSNENKSHISRKILNNETDLINPDNVDKNLTLEDVELSSLHIEEQIMDIDQQRTLEFQRRSSSKKSSISKDSIPSSLSSDRHVRKLTFSDDRSNMRKKKLRRVKSDGGIQKCKKFKPSKNRAATIERIDMESKIVDQTTINILTESISAKLVINSIDEESKIIPKVIQRPIKRKRGRPRKVVVESHKQDLLENTNTVQCTIDTSLKFMKDSLEIDKTKQKHVPAAELPSDKQEMCENSAKNNEEFTEINKPNVTTIIANENQTDDIMEQSMPHEYDMAKDITICSSIIKEENNQIKSDDVCDGHNKTPIEEVLRINNDLADPEIEKKLVTLTTEEDIIENNAIKSLSEPKITDHSNEPVVKESGPENHIKHIEVTEELQTEEKSKTKDSQENFTEGINSPVQHEMPALKFAAKAVDERPSPLPPTEKKADEPVASADEEIFKDYRDSEDEKKNTKSLNIEKTNRRTAKIISNVSQHTRRTRRSKSPASSEPIAECPHPVANSTNTPVTTSVITGRESRCSRRIAHIEPEVLYLQPRRRRRTIKNKSSGLKSENEIAKNEIEIPQSSGLLNKNHKSEQSVNSTELSEGKKTELTEASISYDNNKQEETLDENIARNSKKISDTDDKAMQQSEQDKGNKENQAELQETQPLTSIDIVGSIKRKRRRGRPSRAPETLVIQQEGCSKSKRTNLPEENPSKSKIGKSLKTEGIVPTIEAIAIAEHNDIKQSNIDTIAGFCCKNFRILLKKTTKEQLIELAVTLSASEQNISEPKPTQESQISPNSNTKQNIVNLKETDTQIDILSNVVETKDQIENKQTSINIDNTAIAENLPAKDSYSEPKSSGEKIIEEQSELYTEKSENQESETAMVGEAGDDYGLEKEVKDLAGAVIDTKFEPLTLDIIQTEHTVVIGTTTDDVVEKADKEIAEKDISKSTTMNSDVKNSEQTSDDLIEEAAQSTIDSTINTKNEEIGGANQQEHNNARTEENSLANKDQETNDPNDIPSMPEKTTGVTVNVEHSIVLSPQHSKSDGETDQDAKRKQAIRMAMKKQRAMTKSESPRGKQGRRKPLDMYLPPIKRLKFIESTDETLNDKEPYRTIGSKESKDIKVPRKPPTKTSPKLGKDVTPSELLESKLKPNELSKFKGKSVILHKSEGDDFLGESEESTSPAPSVSNSVKNMEATNPVKRSLTCSPGEQPKQSPEKPIINPVKLGKKLYKNLSASSTEHAESQPGISKEVVQELEAKNKQIQRKFELQSKIIESTEIQADSINTSNKKLFSISETANRCGSTLKGFLKQPESDGTSKKSENVEKSKKAGELLPFKQLMPKKDKSKVCKSEEKTFEAERDIGGKPPSKNHQIEKLNVPTTEGKPPIKKSSQSKLQTGKPIVSNNEIKPFSKKLEPSKVQRDKSCESLSVVKTPSKKAEEAKSKLNKSNLSDSEVKASPKKLEQSKQQISSAPKQPPKMYEQSISQASKLDVPDSDKKFSAKKIDPIRKSKASSSEAVTTSKQTDFGIDSHKKKLERRSCEPSKPNLLKSSTAQISKEPENIPDIPIDPLLETPNSDAENNESFDERILASRQTNEIPSGRISTRSSPIVRKTSSSAAKLSTSPSTTKSNRDNFKARRVHSEPRTSAPLPNNDPIDFVEMNESKIAAINNFSTPAPKTTKQTCMAEQDITSSFGNDPLVNHVTRKRKAPGLNVGGKRSKQASPNPETSKAFPVRITAAQPSLLSEQLPTSVIPSQLEARPNVVMVKRTEELMSVDKSKPQSSSPKKHLSFKTRKLIVRLNRRIVNNWMRAHAHSIHQSKLQSNYSVQREATTVAGAASTALSMETIIGAHRSVSVDIEEAITLPNDETILQSYIATAATRLSSDILPIPLVLPDVKPEGEIDLIAPIQRQPTQNMSTAPSTSAIPGQSPQTMVTQRQATTGMELMPMNRVSPVNAPIDPNYNTIGNTRMFSFLYPMRYHQTYGEVGLDFCCPNLDGPMRAIDPTRLHSKAEVPVLELPQYLVVTTKIISKQDRNIPNKVRAKLEQMAAKEGVPCVVQTLGTNINNTNKTVALPVTITTASPAAITSRPVPTVGPVALPSTLAPKHRGTVPVTKPRANPVLKSALSSKSPGTAAQSKPILNRLDALSKNLAHGTTLSQKILPPHTVLRSSSPAASVARPMPKLLQLAPICPKDKERVELQTRVQVFDLVLQSLARRAVNLTVIERQKTIEEFVKNSVLQPIDVDVGTKLVENYAQYLDVATNTRTPPIRLSSVVTPTAMNITSNQILPRLAPVSSALTSTSKPASHAPKISVTVMRKEQPQQSLRATAPIYGADRSIIGYRFPGVSSPTTSTNTNVGRITATSFNQKLAQSKLQSPVKMATRGVHAKQLATSTPISERMVAVTPMQQRGMAMAAVGSSSAPPNSAVKPNVVRSRALPISTPSPMTTRRTTCVVNTSLTPKTRKTTAQSLPTRVSTSASAALTRPSNIYIVNQMHSQQEECILPDMTGTGHSSGIDNLSAEIKDEVDDDVIALA